MKDFNYYAPTEVVSDYGIKFVDCWKKTILHI